MQRGELATYALGEPELPNVRKLALPTGVQLVRIVAHKGAAHLLDTEGHWHRIGEQVERVPSFDPDDNVGTVAKFKSVRFELLGLNVDDVEIRGAAGANRNTAAGGRRRRRCFRSGTIAWRCSATASCSCSASGRRSRA